MNIGGLKQRITINTPGALSPDGIGGFNEAVSETSDMWAYVHPLSDKEKLLFGIQLDIMAYEILIRYEEKPDISQQNLITFSGETLKVMSVLPDLEEKNTIKIICYG